VPRVFDFRGSSHQVFHIAILGALHVHAAALVQDYKSLRAMDFREIQADRLLNH
jgi:hypothetical protein